MNNKEIKSSEDISNIKTGSILYEQIPHKALTKAINDECVLRAFVEWWQHTKHLYYFTFYIQHPFPNHPKHLINPSSYDLYLQIQITFYASLARIFYAKQTTFFR
ncbi:MAG: hypothetical protein M3R72_07585 [Bacteroidota bacterium]|nr:hypothetical protein [Bacteroidota bacterium]